jgi:F-type H+-transporting ATPase subunit gamma
MAAGKEIRAKIKSFENTKKITKAMEMVSASKMRKAQDRMRAARPYSDKIRNITANLSEANPEYRSPYMKTDGDLAKSSKVTGFIVVTTDKGLCGGLNTNILRAVTNKVKEVKDAGGQVQAVAIGNKGLGFLNRVGVPVVSQAVQLGDAPTIEKLIGPVKVMLDAFVEGKVDRVWVCYTKFINTMRQEPMVEQLLPLSSERLSQSAEEKKAYGWDYIYEPDAASVIDDLLERYIEALVYRSVAENMASEQSARMVAMKAATDNAGNLIAEFKLVYNKQRQAAITKELSEIVGGAAAIGG